MLGGCVIGGKGVADNVGACLGGWSEHSNQVQLRNVLTSSELVYAQLTNILPVFIYGVLCVILMK